MSDGFTASGQRIQSNGTVDFAITTQNLDQIEDLCNRVVTPHRLYPSHRDTAVDCSLNVHGSKDFGLFHIGYRASLGVQVPAIDDDDRLAILIAASGTGQVKVGRADCALTRQQGAILAFGPEIRIDYDDDCETMALLFSRRKISEYWRRSWDVTSGFPLRSICGCLWIIPPERATSV
jgi:hypothetical protein